MISIASLFALFGTVFSLNVMPAFALLTWVMMSWVGFSRPEVDPMILTGVTVCAATVGRLVLVRLSCSLACSRWTRKTGRQSIDAMRAWLEDRKDMTVGLILVYTFSPFPSNYILITCGLTGIRLQLIGLPFSVGCRVSYLIWTHITQTGARYLDEETEIGEAYMGVYFVVSQVVFLVPVYGFAKLGQQHLLQTKRLRWRRRESIVSPAKDTRTKVER